MGNNKFKFLQALRKQNGLNQEQMAEKLGIKRSLYSHIEGGMVQPNYQVLQALQATFNIQLFQQTIIHRS